jgi:hypothetical protein
MHPLITSELACSRQEDLRRDALPRAPRRRRGRRVALVAAALMLALTGTAQARTSSS